MKGENLSWGKTRREKGKLKRDETKRETDKERDGQRGRQTKRDTDREREKDQVGDTHKSIFKG